MIKMLKGQLHTMNYEIKPSLDCIINHEKLVIDDFFSLPSTSDALDIIRPIICKCLCKFMDLVIIVKVPPSIS